jgi:Spy/CpxP family protein refolding chaperone
MLVAAFGIVALNAQEIPERDRTFKPTEKNRMHNRKSMSSMNLTDEQKAQFKTINAEHKKQMEELKKQDNITVKESRERMAAIQKDHKAKIQNLLTAEQKAEIEKSKLEREKKRKSVDGKRKDVERKKDGSRMRQDLNLTDEQKAKMAEGRKATSEKMKAIREDKSLTDEQKKEKTKEVMKAQKENMKSFLTEEQLQKVKSRERK